MTDRILLLVEGLTEFLFVRDALSPHLTLWVHPIIVKTKVDRQGAAYRGGYVTYSQMKRQLLALLADTSAIAVTTMFDLYALPRDFPGLSGLPATLPAVEKVQRLEMGLQNDVADSRFRPYLQLHEFEALLFADPAAINQKLGGDTRQQARLQQIRQSFATPEEINDGVDTAPSKRIQGVFPTYQKVLHGPQIAQSIGLTPLREACPHFGQWLSWLESLQP